MKLARNYLSLCIYTRQSERENLVIWKGESVQYRSLSDTKWWRGPANTVKTREYEPTF